MLSPAALAELETPAYVYDLDEVRRCHRLLRAALPDPSDLYYSLKANPHPAVASALREAGCLAEACSPGELDTALDAGFQPSQILYTGPAKRDQDVLAAMKAGVLLFSVDSPHGLDQLDRIAGTLDVCATAILRINDDSPAPGQALSMTGVASQFGADLAWVLAEPALFGPRPHARPVGFHLYMGTNSADEDALLAQFGQAARTARRLAEATGVEVELLDLGGGFGAPFARAGALPEFASLAGRLAALLDAAFPGWSCGRPRVAFESGRYLTSTSGTLLTRVLDVKQSQGRPVVVLESGINHLGGMSGLRRVVPITPDLVLPGNGGAPAPDTIVAGPLCTPLDSWARAASVPALHAGQLVAVPNVGAYGLTASLIAFLGHPLPDEVIISGGQVRQSSRIELQRRSILDTNRS
jgi:diaminopimelate decarboxylase